MDRVLTFLPTEMCSQAAGKWPSSMGQAIRLFLMGISWMAAGKMGSSMVSSFFHSPMEQDIKQDMPMEISFKD